MASTTQYTPTVALRTLLHRLNTRFTDYSIQSLRQHPDYPSLLAINHTLDQLRIDNLAVRGTYEQLQHEFPKPLLVHTHENGGAYRVVDHLDETQVSFVDQKGKLRSQSKEEFLKHWSGVAMLVDGQTRGVEAEYARNRIRDSIRLARLPGLILGFGLLVGYVFYFTDTLTTPFDYLFLATKALGVAVTVPLLVRLIDKHNPWAKKLCHSTKAGSKINCASILDAPAANFLGLFAWSEIGFLYFTVLFGYLLLFASHANVLVAGLAVAAAPYTIYSIYYQWKARQWCRLCLAVQGVLLLELALAAVFLITYPLDPISVSSVMPLLLVSVIGVSAYSFLKPVLIEWKSQQQQLPPLNRIKYRPEVFQALLKKSLRIDTTGIRPLQFGNPKGKHQLTIISNPTCGPCANAHRELSKLLKTKEDVSLEEIFLVSRETPAYDVAERMLALHQNDPQEGQEAITAYYEQDAKRWMQQYKLTDVEDDQAKQVLVEHMAWCRGKEISTTPTILYNGYPLPPEYRIKDLYYLLD